MSNRSGSRSIVGGLAAATVLIVAGCASTGPLLPEVDLTDPAWTVTTGQALWTPGADRPSLAGELIVAKHAAGEILISFSKPPLPIFTAQTSGDGWRIDFVERGRSYSGTGSPPRRFIWFRLPELIEGAPAPRRWAIDRPADDEIRLANPRSGEKIRVVLDP